MMSSDNPEITVILGRKPTLRSVAGLGLDNEWVVNIIREVAITAKSSTVTSPRSVCRAASMRCGPMAA